MDWLDLFDVPKANSPSLLTPEVSDGPSLLLEALGPLLALSRFSDLPGHSYSASLDGPQSCPKCPP